MLLVNTAVYGISRIFLICVWFISCGNQLFALLPTCARCANKFIRLKWFHDARWVITLKLIFCCFSISGYWFVSRSFFSILLTFYSCVLPPLVFLYGVYALVWVSCSPELELFILCCFTQLNCFQSLELIGWSMAGHLLYHVEDLLFKSSRVMWRWQFRPSDWALKFCWTLRINMI